MMLKQISTSIYLFIFSVFFNIFKSLAKKDKTTFVASLGDNVLFTINELELRTKDHPIVILKTPQCNIPYYGSPRRKVLRFESRNIFHWFKSVYHLATSKYIFVDNYYRFLTVTNFHPDTQCIQLWPAAGAIKQFKLHDLTLESNPPSVLKDFNKVHQQFDHIVVGSEKMVTIINEGFGLSEKQILRSGIPRTDFFFNELEINYVRNLLLTDLPVLKEKKVILYAPTYRDGELDAATLQLDLKKMYKQLKYEYVLLLKLHPAVNGVFENKYPGFILNMSSYPNINHLFVVSDLLITDYSAVPFEFSLLKKPMIFYAYDLDSYAKKRGFWEDYETLVPGPIVDNTDDLIETIRANNFNLELVNNFAAEWNLYSTGHASRNLIKEIYNLKDDHLIEQTNSLIDTTSAESTAVALKSLEAVKSVAVHDPVVVNTIKANSSRN